MPVKFDIYNKEVLANQSDYATVTLLASGDIVDVPVIPTVTNYLSTSNVTISSLAVTNSISAGNIIYALSGNSNLWNAAYNVSTAYQNASANWQLTYLTVSTLSASWEESAEIIPTVTNYLSGSGNTITINDSIIFENLEIGALTVTHPDSRIAGRYYIDRLAGTNELIYRKIDDLSVYIARSFSPPGWYFVGLNAAVFGNGYYTTTTYPWGNNIEGTNSTTYLKIPFPPFGPDPTPIVSASVKKLDLLGSFRSISTIQSLSTVIAQGGNSDQWNRSFNISTAYQNASSSFATNTDLNAVSGLLTPLTLTNTLTGQLVTNTDFGNYQTSVDSALATLLPISVYQDTSGSFATNTDLNAVSGLLTPLTLFSNYQTSVAASTATLLPITEYQSVSGSWLTLPTITNYLSTNNVTISSIILNGSLQGATSATSINIGALSARTLDLIHSPANDGVDPVLNIGETATAGFSGFRLRYEEPTNRLIGSSRTDTTILTSFIITTNTGQVGISGLPMPGQALTVRGNTTLINNLSVGGSLYNDEAEFINKLPVSSALTTTGTLYIHNGGPTGTSIVCNSQQLFLVPIWVPTDCTIDSAGIYASANAASVDVKICIYDAKFDGRPSTRIGGVTTVSSGTTGGLFIASTISPSITLKRGNYYAGIMGFGANVSLNRSVPGNITMGNGMPIMSGIYRLLPGFYDVQGGHLITAISAGSEPPADLSSRTLDTDTGGGVGIISTIRYRQSAPFVFFRLAI